MFNTLTGIFEYNDFMSRMTKDLFFMLISFILFYSFNRAIGLMFVNDPGDWGSIPGWDILKTKKKWYLMPLCLTLSI